MFEFEPEAELDALPELNSEWEFETEPEYEFEGEPFFGKIKKFAKRAAKIPGVRRLGLMAARAALGGLGPVGSIAAGFLPRSEFEPEWESDGEYETDSEDEFGLEYETAPSGAVDPFYEDLGEAEVNPIRNIYPEGLMEYLGHAASEADTEAEADAFIGALVPLAAQLLPKFAPTLMKNAPTLIRGATQLTRFLRRRPSTRKLIRTIPAILQRTVNSMVKEADQEMALGPKSAKLALARQTNKVLGNSQRLVQAYRLSKAREQRYLITIRRLGRM